MREELLRQLRTRFEGVSDAILGRIADKLAKTVTSQDQVAAAVAGVTIQQVIESYGDFRATESAQTAVKNYETKHGLKDGEKVNREDPDEKKKKTEVDTHGGGDDEIKTMLKSIMDANKALSDEIAAMKTGKVTESRKKQLSDITAALPEHLRKGYDRIGVEAMTDDEFDTLIGEVRTEVEGILSQERSRGAVLRAPFVTGKTGDRKTGDSKEATDEEAQAVVNRLNI